MKLYSANAEFWFGEIDVFSPEDNFSRIQRGEIIGDFDTTDGMLVKGRIVPMALLAYIQVGFMTLIGIVPDPPFGTAGLQGVQGWQGGAGGGGTGGGTGTQGIQGFQGFQGVEGLQGAQGAQGWQGFQGLQGVQGGQGLQGWQGFQGLQGGDQILTKYLVGKDATDPYSTIQSAIDAAVTDGHVPGNRAQVLIKLGSYTENLTLAPGVDLIAIDQGQQSYSVSVIGAHTFSCTGGAENWVFVTGIGFTYSNDTPVLTFAGDASNQRLVFRSCLLSKTVGASPTIDVEQSGPGAVEFYDSVVMSTNCIAVVVGPDSASVSVYFENSSCSRSAGGGVVISLATGTLGAFNSEFGGEINALPAAGPDPGDSYVDFTYCKLIAVGVEVLACNTSYGASLRDSTIETDVSPAVTGVGVFYYSSIDYGWGAVGYGFAASLNGGAGALPLSVEAAKNLTFDNAVSGLTGTNVQEAIDELALYGIQGPQGLQGYQGYQGVQGVEGFQGYQGYQGTGVQGYQGPAGDLTLDVPNGQTGTDYTLALTDAGKTVWMDNVAANAVTIPDNGSVAFPVNTVVAVVQEGAGTTSIGGATGVAFNGVTGGSGDVSAQFGAVWLCKRGTDIWIGTGALGVVS
jgi:hypothetical protein